MGKEEYESLPDGQKEVNEKDKLIEQQGEFFKIFDNVKKYVLEEAENMCSLKPEMGSAESQTGNKLYEKPQITESVVDETNGCGAFVLKEQIDHDTRFPQMRYTLYFVDKSGNLKTIFEKHDYVDDGGGGSIYVENDPSIVRISISGGEVNYTEK